jgi:hypothetical protein
LVSNSSLSSYFLLSRFFGWNSMLFYDCFFQVDHFISHSDLLRREHEIIESKRCGIWSESKYHCVNFVLLSKLKRINYVFLWTWNLYWSNKMCYGWCLHVETFRLFFCCVRCVSLIVQLSFREMVVWIGIWFDRGEGAVMWYIATFNNISIISWRQFYWWSIILIPIHAVFVLTRQWREEVNVNVVVFSCTPHLGGDRHWLHR